jgi:phage repressor protein C with HTH and peptisase S24 domain
MTQLNELIAQMQAEQTAAAEAQAAAEAEKQKQAQEFIASMQAKQTAAAEQAAAAEQQRQEQVAAMTQNYMVGQPAVGYNPYQSGQYQNNPYGSAGVPDMGGITSIPVPAAYQPYQPLGGAT